MSTLFSADFVKLFCRMTLSNLYTNRWISTVSLEICKICAPNVYSIFVHQMSILFLCAKCLSYLFVRNLIFRGTGSHPTSPATSVNLKHIFFKKFFVYLTSKWLQFVCQCVSFWKICLQFFCPCVSFWKVCLFLSASFFFHSRFPPFRAGIEKWKEFFKKLLKK